MNIETLVKRQEKRYRQKYKPVKHKGVMGYSRGAWYLRKHGGKAGENMALVK